MPRQMVTLITVLLLTVLATLQYRWTGQLAEAELHQLKRVTENAIRGLADEFDRELTQLFLAFFLDPAQQLQQEHYAGVAERWYQSASIPNILKSVLIVDETDVVTIDIGGEPSENQSLSAWEAVVDRLRSRHPMQLITDEGVLFMVVPIVEQARERRRLRRRLDRSLNTKSYAILELDRDYIVDGWLPQLTDRYLPDDQAFVVTITSPSQLIFQRGTASGPAENRPDATTTIFQLRLFRPPVHPGDPLLHAGERRRRGPWYDQNPLWDISVVHASGSLETAVNHVRIRNLAISLGILGILATALLMLARYSQKTRELSRQQLEFIASISHELMTPLAAIRSAGQNMVDGVIKHEEKIQRYGQLIEKEGSRLVDMVEQVLGFARIQSNQVAELVPIDIGQTIEMAIQQSQSLIQQHCGTITLNIEPGLPLVPGDESELIRVWRNLLGNAMKYAVKPPEIVFNATNESPGIKVTVSDNGPGIPEHEIKRVFEPFFRGSKHKSSKIPGSGLGLSIVQYACQQLGLRIRVENVDGGGSRFTIEFPRTIPAEEQQNAS